MSEGNGRRVGHAARVWLAGGVAALTLAGGEILLRQLDLPHFDACSMPVDYAIPDPELGFAAPPGGEVTGFRLNQQGLRGPVLEVPRPSGHRRILFIGDSTCWGLGVPLEKSFAALATRLLGEDLPDQTLEFVLGAFPGYSSYHSRIMLERLLPMQPDLVVFYVGARNDPIRARYFPDSEIPRRRARLAASWHQVRLLRLLEVAWDRSYRSFFRKLRSEAARARVPPADFRANLDDMAEQLERANAKGLVLVPSVSDGFAARYPLVEQYQGTLEQAAQRNGLAMLRLETRFAAERPERVYVNDGYHLSERGHRITAEEIRRVVVDEGLLAGDHRGATIGETPEGQRGRDAEN